MCAALVSARALDVDQLPIKLGDTYDNVKEAYQTTLEPETLERSAIPGSTSLRLKTKGVWFFFDRSGKIYTIRLDAPFAGKVAGIKIGDTTARMMKVLGKPAKTPVPITNMMPRSFIYYPDDTTTVQFQTAPNTEDIETIFIVK